LGEVSRGSDSERKFVANCKYGAELRFALPEKMLLIPSMIGEVEL